MKNSSGQHCAFHVRDPFDILPKSDTELPQQTSKQNGMGNSSLCSQRRTSTTSEISVVVNTTHPQAVPFWKGVLEHLRPKLNFSALDMVPF